MLYRLLILIVLFDQAARGTKYEGGTALCPPFYTEVPFQPK